MTTVVESAEAITAAAGGTGASPFNVFPPRRSTTDLLAAATVSQGNVVEGVRWLGGVATTETECQLLERWDLGCSTAATDDDALHDVVSQLWQPYVIEALVRCSTFGSGAMDLRGRANALLDSGALSASLEAEAEAGALSAAAGLDNPILEDLPSLGNLGFQLALAELECVARSDAPALGRYMIWANPRIVALWDANGALRKVGNALLTAQDTIVVSAGGFGCDDDWAYITGVARVLLGDPFDTGTEALTVDRATNTTLIRVARPALVFWPTCFGAKVAVNTGGPLTGNPA
jgi:hypothetical protein